MLNPEIDFDTEDEVYIYNPLFEDSELTEIEVEMYNDELALASMAMEKSWDNDNLTIEEMCNQIDEMCLVLEKRSSYSNFIKQTNIKHNNFIN